MGTTILFLDKTAVKKDGTAPIKIILSHGKSISKISTGVDVPLAWWNEKSLTISSKHMRLQDSDTLILKISRNFAKARAEQTIPNLPQQAGPCLLCRAQAKSQRKSVKAN